MFSDLAVWMRFTVISLSLLFRQWIKLQFLKTGCIISFVAVACIQNSGSLLRSSKTFITVSVFSCLVVTSGHSFSLFQACQKINYTRNRSFASSKFAHVAAAMRAGHSDDKLSKYKSIFRTRLGPCLRTDLSRVDWQRQIADSRIRYKSINTAGPRIDQIRCMFTFCCYIVCDFTFQRQSRILYYDSGVTRNWEES